MLRADTSRGRWLCGVLVAMAMSVAAPPWAQEPGAEPESGAASGEEESGAASGEEGSGAATGEAASAGEDMSETTEDEELVEEEMVDDPAGPGPADAAAAGEGAEQVDAATADSDSLYWADLRDIYTVQKRPIEKNGRFAVSLYLGIIPNNIFEQYFPIGLRFNYFVIENIGFELSTSFALRADTGLSDVVQDDKGIGAQNILIGDTQRSHTTFGVVWTPIFGKTAFLNDVLNYFELYLFGGMGMVVTQTQPNFGAELETTLKPEGAIGAGLMFYLDNKATVRLDLRQFVFQKVEGVGGVANPTEVSLGFGWFF